MRSLHIRVTDFVGGDTCCTSKADTTESGGCCVESVCTPEIIRAGNCCTTYCIANDGSTTKPGEYEII